MGIILYELLLGATPFYGSSPEEVFDMAVHGKLKFFFIKTETFSLLETETYRILNIL